MSEPDDPHTLGMPIHGGGALVGYARVSAGDQDMSVQIEALKHAGCIQIFEDVAGGAKSERTGLDDALAYVQPGDTLVVWKLDRLGRSLPHLVDVVYRLLTQGIGFRSLTDGPIDTTTPSGTLIFHIFAALAEFERSLIRERTNAGLKAAAEQGRKGGRKAVVTPAILKTAKEMRASGLSVREAAAALKISKTPLYEALKADAAEVEGEPSK